MNTAGDTEVIIASLALVGTCVAAIIWALKYFARTLTKDLVAHTAAAEAQVRTNREVVKVMKDNIEVSGEMLAFMRNLNGKLAKAAIDTAKATSDTLAQTKEIIKEAKK